jgi:DNA-binding beta-propeller fold protein YncE
LNDMSVKKQWSAALSVSLALGLVSSCGRTSRDPAPAARPGGGAAGAVDGSSGSANGELAGDDSPGGDVSGGAAGSDSAGAAGSEQCPLYAFGGAPGSTLPPAADSQISQTWRWYACGVIPPYDSVALQAVFPRGGTDLGVLYNDGRVVLHPLSARTPQRLLRPAGSPPDSIAFSPDSSQLAEVKAGVVQIHLLADSTPLSPMAVDPDCTGKVVRFSAEGGQVLAWDGASLCVWQIGSGQLIRKIAGNFSSAALSGGRLLAAEFGSPPTLTSWDLASGTRTAVELQLPAGTRPISDDSWGIVISPRADALGAGSVLANARQTALWSADGSLRGLFPAEHTDARVVFSESGAFASAGDVIVDLASNRSRFTLPYGALADTVDDAGERVAFVEQLADSKAAAQVLDLNGADDSRFFGMLLENTYVNGLAVSPDGSRLIVAGFGSLLWRLAPDIGASEAIQPLQVSIALAANFTADGQKVLVSGDGWGVFSAQDGADFAFPLAPPPPTVPSTSFDCIHTSARISSTGRWLAYGHYGASISIVSWSSCQTSVLDIPTARCDAETAFSKDDTLMATSGPELYRTSDWSLVWAAGLPDAPTASNSSNLFQDVQFTPDGQALLVTKCAGQGDVSSISCTHTLHSLANGSVIQVLPALHSPGASFSPGGAWVTAGGTALHVASGQSFIFRPNTILSTFTPDGDIIGIDQHHAITKFCRTP